MPPAGRFQPDCNGAAVQARAGRTRACPKGVEVTQARPTIPNRLSADPQSCYYDSRFLALKVRVNGREQRNVCEYSITGKWAIIEQLDGRGNVKTERGQIATITVLGKIEPYWPEGKI